MARESFQPPVRIPPAVDPRSLGRHGLARLRAERALVVRYAEEYRRLEPRLGHVGAISTLVRRHTKEYGRMVTASAAGTPELLGFARRRFSA
jgi:hypothetical protein